MTGQARVPEPGAGPWPAAGWLLRAATAPAALAARSRPDLRVLIAQDAVRFAGARSGVFQALAVVAVAYPIAASLVHALGSPTQGGDPLANALRPGFDAVYAESIPFMLVAIGLGLLSPSLGVLLLSIFVPADLLAANAKHQLDTMPWQGPAGALLARLASYGLLWILAVEIPLWARGLALGWARPRGGEPALARTAVVLVSLTAIFVYLWASALPLLIAPVFTWTITQIPSRLASDPTWYDWPILVFGAAALAAVAAVWPRSLGAAAAATAAVPRVPAVSPPAGWLTAVRQTAAALALALLLGGLITSLAEAIVLVGGLLVAGPVATVVVRRLPAPRFLRAARPAVRLVASLAIVLGGSLAVLIFAGSAMFATDYLPFTGLVVGSMIVFRVLIGAGVRPAAVDPAGTVAQHAARGGAA